MRLIQQVDVNLPGTGKEDRSSGSSIVWSRGITPFKSIVHWQEIAGSLRLLGGTCAARAVRHGKWSTGTSKSGTAMHAWRTAHFVTHALPLLALIHPLILHLLILCYKKERLKIMLSADVQLQLSS